MPGSYLSRSWEVAAVPAGTAAGGAGKGNRNPAIDAAESTGAAIPVIAVADTIERTAGGAISVRNSANPMEMGSARTSETALVTSVP